MCAEDQVDKFPFESSYKVDIWYLLQAGHVIYLLA